MTWTVTPDVGGNTRLFFTNSFDQSSEETCVEINGSIILDGRVDFQNMNLDADHTFEHDPFLIYGDFHKS